MSKELECGVRSIPHFQLETPNSPLRTPYLLEFQLLIRIPEKIFEVEYLIILHPYTFRLQQLLHHERRFEMIFPGEHSFAVDHAMRRHFGMMAVRCIHGPAHHTRGTFYT